MMTMREMLENDYTVIIESIFGDEELHKDDLEIIDLESYEEDSEIISIDEVNKVAYFEEIDNGQYDE